MNTKSLYKLSYGVYFLSAQEDGRDNACIINTAVQVANNPTRISIASIKGGCTHDMIARTGTFNLSPITEDAEMDLFRRFGMQSGRDADKFAGFEDVARSQNGLLYLTRWASAFLSVKVTQSLDLGTHTLFIGELTDGEVLSNGPCATYGYYQSVIKGRAAKSAPVQETAAAGAPVQPAADGPVKKWVCPVCGYVHEGPEPPDQCPLCHVPGSRFVLEGAETESAPAAEAVTVTAADAAGSTATAAAGDVKKWVCPVCGYVYEGPEPPAECPVCHIPGSKFTVLQENAALAAEHKFGIYASTVKDNPDVSAADKQYILEQLMANFKGECSEVGMYLCMGRIADRGGDPQMGQYWRKSAYEEAEHAAKFAELLGSDLEANMTDDTEKNLRWRIDCEFGATQGKTDLALLCKKLGLDALHDTIHEMARDEARHGKALKGLLDRYFH